MGLRKAISHLQRRSPTPCSLLGPRRALFSRETDVLLLGGRRGQRSFLHLLLLKSFGSEQPLCQVDSFGGVFAPSVGRVSTFLRPAPTRLLPGRVINFHLASKLPGDFNQNYYEYSMQINALGT